MAFSPLPSSLEEALKEIKMWRENHRQQRTWERPLASLTDGQADNLIANLEPLLDAKNQSWANAEKMLIDILAAVPQGSDK